MYTLFALSQRTAYLQHVHVIEMSPLTVSRQWHVLLDNALHATPAVADVTADSPRGSEVLSPCARECPATDVNLYIVAPCLLDGAPDGRIAFLLVEVELLSSPTVVNLNEVVAPVSEVEPCVLLLMSVETCSDAVLVLVPDTAAGDSSRIRIDACLQSFRVDIVADSFHATRKPLRMRMHLSFLIPVSEKAVVNIDIGVASILQTCTDDGIGLPLDERVTDVHPIGVP